MEVEDADAPGSIDDIFDLDEYDEKFKDEDMGETVPVYTPLLFTCKSIHKETLLQFYARKVFIFTSAGSAERFLDMLLFDISNSDISLYRIFGALSVKTK